jgi:hypothetical protein
MNNISESLQKKDIELADILRTHIDKIDYISTYEKKVINAITSCRTKALGVHKICKCDHCAHIEVLYNSCRNRHCPKCQGSNGFKWVNQRLKDLLPVQYFHVVFTIPHVLNDIILYNKEIGYNLLFKTVSQTLKETALTKKNLGAKIGFIEVLHTWDQQLNFHPHIHCIVAGGGIALKNNKWINCKKKYLINNHILSEVFRGKFLDYLEKSYNKKRLIFTGELSYLNDGSRFKDILKKSCEHNWVVYCKKPFAGPLQVFNYLAQYTHRVGISNKRILSMENDKVTFSWKDRVNNYEKKTTVIDAVLFSKRFLLHILPKGFMRIRYYGILGNPVCKKNIETCRQLLKEAGVEDVDRVMDSINNFINNYKEKYLFSCPVCKEGKLIEIDTKGNIRAP